MNNEERIDRVIASCTLVAGMIVDGGFTSIAGLRAYLTFVPALSDTLECTA